ncbi:MAG: biotin--[acetyl-CoA-carboxylase] ligase [Nitrospiraceae bacterium]
MITSSLPAYDIAAIQAGLRTAAFGRTIHYYASVDSTNNVAVALAQDGAPHGTVVLADAQSAGRGRRGRHWHSPPAQHLYCSIILRGCPEQTEYLTIVPLASALAVADAMFDAAAVQGRLKWPNDVLIGEKKVAGILCESVGGQPMTIVVVGIGMNINGRPDDFPQDFRNTAATLSGERGSPVDRTGLVSALLNRLEERIALISARTLADLLDAYRTRCSTLGLVVRAMVGDNNAIEGTAEAVGMDGSLHIRRGTPAGSGRSDEIVIVHSADIVHLRKMTGTTR